MFIKIGTCQGEIVDEGRNVRIDDPGWFPTEALKQCAFVSGEGPFTTRKEDASCSKEFLGRRLMWEHLDGSVREVFTNCDVWLMNDRGQTIEHYPPVVDRAEEGSG